MEDKAPGYKVPKGLSRVNFQLDKHLTLRKSRRGG